MAHTVISRLMRAGRPLKGRTTRQSEQRVIYERHGQRAARSTEKALDGRLAGHATFERSRQLADEPLARDRHLPGNAWPLVNHPANLGDDRVV